MPDRPTSAAAAVRPATRSLVAVLAFVALGAALRFVELGAKSFWRDEGYTVRLVREDLGSALALIVEFESTPPLYYVVVWLWCQVLGSGEVGIRSLSALLGTATVLVAWHAGRELVSHRVGVAAAGLVAVNPILVWYSQEARSYALVVLLGGLGFLFFAQALRGSAGRPLLWWTVVSGLALCTHWFAAFLVGAQGAWLLVASRFRRQVTAACAVLVVVLAALLPLLVVQMGQGRQYDWITDQPLLVRVVQLPALLLVGFETPSPVFVAGVAAVLAAVCLWPLRRRANGAERRGAVLGIGVAAAGIGAPIALALAGTDYFYYRNVLGPAVPLALVLAAGCGAARAGRAPPAAAACLGLLSIAIVLVTIGEPKYHREDWRGAASALGAPDVDRAVVMTPAYGTVGLAAYMPGTTRMSAPGRPVGEVVLLALPPEDTGSLATAAVPRTSAAPPAPWPGLRLVERREGKLYTLLRYRARRPVRLGSGALARSGIGGDPATVLLQPAARG